METWFQKVHAATERNESLEWGLNPRSPAYSMVYEASALPLSYRGTNRRYKLRLFIFFHINYVNHKKNKQKSLLWKIWVKQKRICGKPSQEKKPKSLTAFTSLLSTWFLFIYNYKKIVRLTREFSSRTRNIFIYL